MCGGDLDFVYAKDPMGAMWWARTKKQSESGLAAHNFPDGEKRSRLKEEDPSRPYGEVRDRAKDLSWFEYQIDATLKQYGRPFFQDDLCDLDSCFDTTEYGADYPLCTVYKSSFRPRLFMPSDEWDGARSAAVD